MDDDQLRAYRDKWALSHFPTYAQVVDRVLTWRNATRKRYKSSLSGYSQI